MRMALSHPVCKGHVLRNTDALIENLTPAAGRDTDGSPSALGVQPKQAVADLLQLQARVRARQPEAELSNSSPAMPKPTHRARVSCASLAQPLLRLSGPSVSLRVSCSGRARFLLGREDIGSQVIAGHLQPRHEARTDSRWLQVADEAAVLNSAFLVQKDVGQDNHPALHSFNGADVGHFARAIAQPGLLHDQIERRGDLRRARP